MQTNSFSRDLAGLKKFYKWMRRYSIDNPFGYFDAPRARRAEDAKWLDAEGRGAFVSLVHPSSAVSSG
ncbi:hypothetical protein AB0H77_31275 [Streptomyces sp. NPDC050844]|uniref:hypothetical protein n=1 Tax=Streptomyces sp. NPDC050844 TaxID=3155790 RepID=UPI0033FE8CC9